MKLIFKKPHYEAFIVFAELLLVITHTPALQITQVKKGHSSHKLQHKVDVTTKDSKSILQKTV